MLTSHSSKSKSYLSMIPKLTLIGKWAHARLPFPPPVKCSVDHLVTSTRCGLTHTNIDNASKYRSTSSPYQQLLGYIELNANGLHRDLISTVLLGPFTTEESITDGDECDVTFALRKLNE
jgi:hypothetical protein